MLSWTFYKVWTGFSDKLSGCFRMDHQEGHDDSELKLSTAEDLHLEKNNNTISTKGSTMETQRNNLTGILKLSFVEISLCKHKCWSMNTKKSTE